MNQQITQLFKEMSGLEGKLFESQSELKTAKTQLSERTKSLHRVKKQLGLLESFSKNPNLNPSIREDSRSPRALMQKQSTIHCYVPKKDDPVDI